MWFFRLLAYSRVALTHHVAVDVMMMMMMMMMMISVTFIDSLD